MLPGPVLPRRCQTTAAAGKAHAPATQVSSMHVAQATKHRCYFTDKILHATCGRKRSKEYRTSRAAHLHVLAAAQVPHVHTQVPAAGGQIPAVVADCRRQQRLHAGLPGASFHPLCRGACERCCRVPVLVPGIKPCPASRKAKIKLCPCRLTAQDLHPSRAWYHCTHLKCIKNEGHPHNFATKRPQPCTMNLPKRAPGNTLRLSQCLSGRWTHPWTLCRRAHRPLSLPAQSQTACNQGRPGRECRSICCAGQATSEQASGKARSLVALGEPATGAGFRGAQLPRIKLHFGCYPPLQVAHGLQGVCHVMSMHLQGPCRACAHL